MIFASTYSSPRQNIFLSFVLLFYRPPTSPLSSSNVVRWMNSMHRGVAVLQLFLPLTFFLQDHLVWPPNAEVHMLLQLLLHPSSFTLWVGDSPSQLGTPLVTVARWQGRDFGTCCMRWCTVLVLEKMGLIDPDGLGEISFERQVIGFSSIAFYLSGSLLVGHIIILLTSFLPDRQHKRIHDSSDGIRWGPSPGWCIY